MQSWNSKGMGSIDEVKVKAPGGWKGREVKRFCGPWGWNFGQEFQLRHSMGRAEVRGGWGHEGRAAKVNGCKFRTVSWSGSRGHEAEEKNKQFDSSGEEGGAVVFWQCTWHSFLNGHGHWRLEGRVSGTCTWYIVQPGSWKWAWSQGSRVGRHRKRRERTTESAERLRRSGPGTGRFPARRGRASLRRTDSWCSACSPPGSSHLSPAGRRRPTVSIKWKSRKASVSKFRRIQVGLSQWN